LRLAILDTPQNFREISLNDSPEISKKGKRPKFCVRGGRDPFFIMDKPNIRANKRTMPLFKGVVDKVSEFAAR